MAWVEEYTVSPGNGRRRKDGRWIRYRAGYRGPDGRKHRRSFDRKADAEAWARREEEQIRRDEWTDPRARKITMGDFWPVFLAAKSRRPRTLERYQTLATKHILPRFGDRLLASISPDDVAAFKRDLEEGGDPKALPLLRSVFRAAIAGRRLTLDPTAGIAMPAPSRAEMRFLSVEELGALAEAVPDRYRALIHVLGFAGLRIGEAVALRPEDLDALRRRVTVTQALGVVGGRVEVGDVKTKASRRAVAVPRFLAEMLTEHLEEHPPAPVEVDFRTGPGAVEARRMRLVFSSPAGRPLRPGNWRRRVFYPAVEAAQLGRARIHDLRHTSVALAVAQGAHPLEIKARLGHESITTTLDVYGHLFEGLDERLAERLDEAFRGATPRAAPAVVNLEDRR